MRNAKPPIRRPPVELLPCRGCDAPPDDWVLTVDGVFCGACGVDDPQGIGRAWPATREEMARAALERATMTAQEARKTDSAGGRSGGKAGSVLEDHLATSMRLLGLPEPEREYVFHPPRRFRLDFAWPDRMLAVEVEGGIYRGGGHTHVKDLKRDMEKGNLLAMDGWRLLRFHGDQVRSGEAVDLIRRALEVVVEGKG